MMSLRASTSRSCLSQSSQCLQDNRSLKMHETVFSIFKTELEIMMLPAETDISTVSSESGAHKGSLFNARGLECRIYPSLE